jgi:hypothetical protein
MSAADRCGGESKKDLSDAPVAPAATFAALPAACDSGSREKQATTDGPQLGQTDLALDPCSEAFLWESMGCNSAETEVVQAGSIPAPTQDPCPSEAAQEEATNPAPTQDPCPKEASQEDNQEEEAISCSSLPPFGQLLTPPLSPRPALKVYSRRRPRAAGGGRRQPDAFLSSALSGRAGLTEPQHHSDQDALSLQGAQQTFAAGVEGTIVLPSAKESTTAVPSKEFIDNITTKISAMLPVPASSSQRVRGSAPSSTPRRSRRLAGAGVEFHATDLTTRAKKRTMKALKIIGENGSIDQHAEDEYARIFSEPLSDQHIRALATLFGWAFPSADRAEVNAIPS